MNARRLLAAALVVLALSPECRAGSGVSALTFLRIAPSARASGFGETFTAVADDVNASYWNPAGIANLESMQLSFMHLFYWDSGAYEYVAFSYPLGDKFKIGAHVAYLNYGSIDKTLAADSTVVGSFSPYDLAIAGTAAYKFSSTLQAGVNIKLAMQSIDTYSASAIAFDGGVLYGIPFLLESLGGKDFTLGAALSNLGGAVNGDNLPLTLRAGFSVKFSVQEENDLLTAATLYYPFDSGTLCENIGGELIIDKQFAVRGGYKFGYDAGSLTAGLGWFGSLPGMFRYSIDYAYAPSGNLGDTHRISVGLIFEDDYRTGKPRKKVK